MKHPASKTTAGRLASLLLMSAILYNHASGQTADKVNSKVVELNCDTKTTVSGLPYNQDIQFKVKCKNLPPDKITEAFLLENKGKLSGPRSIKAYKDSTLNRKIYYLDMGQAKDSSLELALSQNSDRYKPWNRKGPKYRLLPSRSYSLYLFTNEVDEATQELLTLLRNIGNIGFAGSLAQRILFNKKLYTWKNENLRKKGFLPLLVPDTNQIANTYITNIHPLDDSILTHWNTLNTSARQLKPSISADDRLFLFHLVNLLKDTSNTCFKNYRCSTFDCSLIEALTGLARTGDESKQSSLYTLRASFRDLADPAYRLIEPEDVKGMKTKQSSTIAQLNVIKQFMQTLEILVHDTCNKDKLSGCFCGDSSFKLRFDTLSAHLQKLETDYTSLSSYRNSYFESVQNRLSAIHRYLFSSQQFHMLPVDTYIYDFDVRSKQTITPVFGYAFIGFQKGFTSFTPYTGINLSLQPLDENIPFRVLRDKTIWQRLNFLIGFTLASIQEQGKRDDLFSNKSNLLTGIGLKLTHIVSLNAGAVVFRKEDPNPFITTKKIATVPFAGLAINLKVQSLFEGFKNLILAK